MFNNNEIEEIVDVEVCEICSTNRRKKILMVVTSADSFDEHQFALPYKAFIKQGYEVTTASPKGGAAPLDPRSENLYEDIEWHDAKKALNDTVPINTVDFTEFDALVLPGGHGPILDLYKDENLGKIIEDYSIHKKLIAAICHGPAGLLSAKINGIPFVNGKRLTCFTNEEETEAKMNNLVPFMLEDELKDAGAVFVKESPGKINIVEDGNLITGQNYQSSKAFADAIINYLNQI